MHCHPYALELLLNLAARILRADPCERSNGAEHAAAYKELEPADAVANGDEEPRERAAGGDGRRRRAKDRFGLGNVDDVDGWRELLQADVANVRDHWCGVPGVLLRGVGRRAQRRSRLLALRVERLVV